jgi:hypothetical protein
MNNSPEMNTAGSPTVAPPPKTTTPPKRIIKRRDPNAETYQNRPVVTQTLTKDGNIVVGPDDYIFPNSVPAIMRPIKGIRHDNPLVRLRTWQAEEAFSQYANVPFTARALWLDEMQNIDRIKEIIEMGQEMVADYSLPVECRIAAGKMVAEVALAYQSWVEQAVTLAEKANENKDGPKRKNLPPQLAVQVNVNPTPGGTAAVTTAKNGAQPEKVDAGI